MHFHLNFLNCNLGFAFIQSPHVHRYVYILAAGYVVLSVFVVVVSVFLVALLVHVGLHWVVSVFLFFRFVLS